MIRPPTLATHRALSEADCRPAAFAPTRPQRRTQLLRWLHSAHIYVGLWGVAGSLLRGGSAAAAMLLVTRLAG